ncbi:hypothetical protein E5D57_007451 [Metarhizium anisopliae]|nr:hypothetical protein E5D57_007451 [Metarhizium anisopliae]
MHSVIRFPILNRMVPDIPNAQGFFDFKQASEVAAEVAHAAAREQGIAFRHYSSRAIRSLSSAN